MGVRLRLPPLVAAGFLGAGFAGGGFVVFLAPRLVGLESWFSGAGEGEEGIRASGTGPLFVRSRILAFFSFRSMLNYQIQQTVG